MDGAGLRPTNAIGAHPPPPPLPHTHAPPRSYFLGVRDPEKEVVFEGTPPKMFAFEGSRMPNRADEENRLRALLLCEIDSYSQVGEDGLQHGGAADISGTTPIPRAAAKDSAK